MPKPDYSQVPLPSPEQGQRIADKMHRVQSAIAFFEGRRDSFNERCSETESKHLRVGVNSALVECSAMARLLFRKGLITSEEYFDTLEEAWDEEVGRYRARVKSIAPALDI